MEENNLESWLPKVEVQPFATTFEPVDNFKISLGLSDSFNYFVSPYFAFQLQLMEAVTNLVSRDKLIEWERFATEQQNRSNDDIFPAVRFFGLTISLLVFSVALIVNFITPNDPIASRCMALLLLVVCLWVTEVSTTYMYFFVLRTAITSCTLKSTQWWL